MTNTEEKSIHPRKQVHVPRAIQVIILRKVRENIYGNILTCIGQYDE